MNPADVKNKLGNYLRKKDLEVDFEYDVFSHAVDDQSERSFKIDIATNPFAKKGSRTELEAINDKHQFNVFAARLDTIITNELNIISMFPNCTDFAANWRLSHNPNPMSGLAIEIENTLSKYFLGSLLAAAIAGRWGIVVVENESLAGKWTETMRRMRHKGSVCPIPSNVLVIGWYKLSHHIAE
jgi:hypothetical protein